VQRVFAESALNFRRKFVGDDVPENESSRSRGISVDRDMPDGTTEHRIVERYDDDVVRSVLDGSLRVPSTDQDAEYRSLAQQTGAELTLSARHQHVAAGPEDSVFSVERYVSSTEVRLYAEDGTSHAQILLGALDDLEATHITQAADDVRARLAVPVADELPERPDLVLLPGLAGSFFHEVVGHPMESDVVASGTSYLGMWMGERVAPEWLSVVDGAQRAVSGYRSAIDDEGTPCRDAWLIDRGRVGESMTDLAIAECLGQKVQGTHDARATVIRPSHG
jgi:TldD protein